MFYAFCTLLAIIATIEVVLIIIAIEDTVKNVRQKKRS
jgi:hypothetical protein